MPPSPLPEDARSVRGPATVSELDAGAVTCALAGCRVRQDRGLCLRGATSRFGVVTRHDGPAWDDHLVVVQTVGWLLARRLVDLLAWAEGRMRWCVRYLVPLRALGAIPPAGPCVAAPWSAVVAGPVHVRLHLVHEQMEFLKDTPQGHAPRENFLYGFQAAPSAPGVAITARGHARSRTPGLTGR